MVFGVHFVHKLHSLLSHHKSILSSAKSFWRLKYRFFSTKLESFEHPALREKTGIWIKPARRHPTLTNEGVFILLNETKSLASVGWTGNNCEKLWRYHQHYFDDLNAFGAIKRKALQLNLMLNWVQENKIGSGIGWQPYPTSLRIVNWIKWELAGNNLQKFVRKV